MAKPNPVAKAREEYLQVLVRAAQKHYDSLSPKRREMVDWAQRINWVCGQLMIPRRNEREARERIARHLLTSQVGAAYAERMFSNDEFRKIIGLPRH